MKIRLFSVLIGLWMAWPLLGQVLEKDPRHQYNPDSVRAILDAQPYFSLSRAN